MSIKISRCKDMAAEQGTQWQNIMNITVRHSNISPQVQRPVITGKSEGSGKIVINN